MNPDSLWGRYPSPALICGNRQSEGVPMRTLYLVPNNGGEDLMDPPKNPCLAASGGLMLGRYVDLP
jgi:hypothetical protein